MKAMEFMSKYVFSEIRKLKELPEDVNKICTDTLMKIDPTGDYFNFFKDKERKKLFGTMNFFHPVKKRLVASFELQSGVCKMFKLCEFLEGTDNHFFRTVINDAVSFEKGKKHERIND